MKRLTIATIATIALSATSAMAEITLSGDGSIGGVWDGTNTALYTGYKLDVSATTPESTLTFGLDFSISNTFGPSSSVNVAFGNLRVSYGNIDGAADYRMGEIKTGGLGANSYINNNSFGESPEQVRVDYNNGLVGISISANGAFDEFGVGGQFSIGTINVDTAVFSNGGNLGYAIGTGIALGKVDVSMTYANFNSGAVEGVDIGASLAVTDSVDVGSFYARNIAANTDVYGAWSNYVINDSATAVLSIANNGFVEVGVALTF